MICPDCGGFGYYMFTGEECGKCKGIGELPDIPPEPPIPDPKPTPPEYEPGADDDVSHADWWKQDDDENGTDETQAD